jgi:hypothetical protein
MLTIILFFVWGLQVIVCRFEFGVPQIHKSNFHFFLFISEVLFGIIVGLSVLIGVINYFFIHGN